MMRAEKGVFKAFGGLERAAYKWEEGERCGFALSGGTLFHGGSARLYEGSAGKYTFPAGCVPEALYFLADGGSFCAAAYAAGKMYFCASDGGAFAETAATFQAPPAAVAAFLGGEVLVLSDGASTCVFSSEGISANENIPPFTAGGYAYDRLWLYTGEGSCRLRFSALLDIADFENGGYIDLPDGRGDAVALVDVNNVFYLFRRFGIQKLTAKGAEDEFALSDEPAPVSEIYAACAENGRAYFLTERGLFSFGGGAEKIPFAEDPSPGGAKLAACGGAVCLAANFAGENKIGVYCGGTCLLPEAGRALAAAKTPSGARMLFYKDGGIYVLPTQEGCAPAEWKSGGVLPFDGAECVLEELTLAGEGYFTLVCASEYGERSFTFAAEGGAKRVRPSLRGARFSYRVISRGDKGRVFSLTAGYSRRT